MRVPQLFQRRRIMGVFLNDTDDFNLLYDANGLGDNPFVQIAHFDTAVALNASHFIITA